MLLSLWAGMGSPMLKGTERQRTSHFGESSHCAISWKFIGFVQRERFASMFSQKFRGIRSSSCLAPNDVRNLSPGAMHVRAFEKASAAGTPIPSRSRSHTRIAQCNEVGNQRQWTRTRAAESGRRRAGWGPGPSRPSPSSPLCESLEPSGWIRLRWRRRSPSTIL